MPFATVRGLKIRYQIIGDKGPFVALITGGRRGHDEFIPIATKLASEGYRVVLHDRRNTGASDILIDGSDGEEAIWTDDLYDLLGQIGARPAFVGGSSSGARTSMLFYLRHPDAVRALLLFRITGGPHPEARLPENYYGQYIKAAQQGGMAAVCDTEQYRERIEANPANKDRLMAMDPAKYIAVMQNWLDIFTAVKGSPIMGVTEEQLRSIKCPAVVIPGNDRTHNSSAGQAAARLIPGSVLHKLPITDQDVDLMPYDQWSPLEPEIVATFVKLMKKVEAQA